jgi:isoleucyl-tRNA synthetase
VVYISDTKLLDSLDGQNMADICITSQLEIRPDAAPAEAFTLDDVAGVGVVPSLAQGRKCQRSWKVLPDVGSVGDYPDLSPRDAAAVAEFDASA